jgi:anti-sigma regulatory factor (Ser/Thr protein kinase)
MNGAGDRTEIRLRLDALAAGAARILVAQSLGDHASATLLDTAKRLISELVTNAVRHSGGSCHDAILVRVHTLRRTLRLEVEDPGRDAVIARVPPIPRAAALRFAPRADTQRNSEDAAWALPLGPDLPRNGRGGRSGVGAR